MYSWESLPPIPLTPSGEIGRAFISANVLDYRVAACFVSRLPYGRNSDVSDPLVVLHEQRGTCSTKHSLLRRLAIEQGLDVHLVLGIFMMDGANTPGAASVLKKHGVLTLPEAHCYLRSGGRRVDVTRDQEERVGTLCFLHEEDIAPEQIGEYKVNLHRQFLRRWIAQSDAGRSVDEMWQIREECIRALSLRAAEMP
jgi:hypothetical protein